MPKNITIVLSFLTLMAADALAMFPDDPFLSKVSSEIEYLQEDGEDIIEWDVDFWVGRDLNKIWLKSSGEYEDSGFENANVELVHSRAISAYWDRQIGIRHDFKSEAKSEFAQNPRNWVSFGFIGTAPYFLEVDARLFVGEESSSQILIEMERELMISQQWVLTPELDIIANGRTNREYGEGSGLAEVEFSLTLGYEHRGNRKFQPFIGVSTHQSFGVSKRLRKENGESSGDVLAKVGIHWWF